MNTITEFDIGIRLVLSFFAGAIVGFERSSRHQVAGLRTHILIAQGATLLMLLSIWMPKNFSSNGVGDPGRIAAQVVSGIGFLGAGAIIRLGNNVRGLTTAASLWLVAAVGLAIGAGLYLGAIVAEALALVTLIGMGIFEKKFFPSERNKIMDLFYKDTNPNTNKSLETIRLFGVRVQSVDLNQTVGKSGKEKGSKLKLLVGLPVNIDTAKFVSALKETGVERIEIKEKW
ncbi:methyltransferase [Spirochaetia bacterium]|nr:methyltransferase [Spirochaetia bacterium]